MLGVGGALSRMQPGRRVADAGNCGRRGCGRRKSVSMTTTYHTAEPSLSRKPPSSSFSSPLSPPPLSPPAPLALSPGHTLYQRVFSLRCVRALGVASLRRERKRKRIKSVVAKGGEMCSLCLLLWSYVVFTNEMISTSVGACARLFVMSYMTFK